MHLFVYGTLTDEEFLHRITKRPLGHFTIVEANLPNFIRSSSITIKKTDTAVSVIGRLVLNVEKKDIILLDEYENCNHDNSECDETNWYNRKIVEVITRDNKKINAYAYIPNF
ncbi:MAG: gamma-glutamylcyclotransferase family protein [Candidatus Helarchaeota archaeon]